MVGSHRVVTTVIVVVVVAMATWSVSVYQHSVAVEWVLTPPVALVVMVTPSVPTMDIKVLCTCTVKVYRIKTNSLLRTALHIRSTCLLYVATGWRGFP